MTSTQQPRLQKIEGQQYETVQSLKRAGLAEWQAVAQVLGVSEDTNFVTFAAGTSSRPEDGFWVKFF